MSFVPWTEPMDRAHGPGSAKPRVLVLKTEGVKLPCEELKARVAVTRDGLFRAPNRVLRERCRMGTGPAHGISGRSKG
jgi:hypothetical protein